MIIFIFLIIVGFIIIFAGVKSLDSALPNIKESPPANYREPTPAKVPTKVYKPDKPKVYKPKKTKEEIIGECFELDIVTELKNLSKEYKVFHNILFKDGNIMVQIDFIIVSPYGIFVIEAKAHKGIIIGDLNSQYWVQKLGNKNYKLYNPIKQNDAHINVLKYYLENIPFIPIVVFKDSTILNTKYAIKLGELLDTINKYKKVVLTDKQVSYVNAIIYKYITTDPKDIEQHKNNVKKYG